MPLSRSASLSPRTSRPRRSRQSSSTYPGDGGLSPAAVHAGASGSDSTASSSSPRRSNEDWPDGKWFGIENFGVVPDAIVMGKAIASGCWGLWARADIMEKWEAPAHLFTAAGNPVCCAASWPPLTSSEENLLQNAVTVGSTSKNASGHAGEVRDHRRCTGHRALHRRRPRDERETKERNRARGGEDLLPGLAAGRSALLLQRLRPPDPATPRPDNPAG